MTHKVGYVIAVIAITIFGTVFEVEGQLSLNRIRAISWSPGGDKIASSKNDGTIQIQNAITGQVIFTLQGDTTGPTVALAFSPDISANKLASGGADGVVRIWNTNTSSILFSLTGHSTVIVGLTWNPSNPALLASLSYDGTIKVWNTITGNPVFSGGAVNRTALDIDWSPDGTKLITASGNGLSFWNANSGTFVSAAVSANPGNDGETISVDWGNNQNLVVSGSSGNKLRSWNSSTGIIANTFSGHAGSVNSATISPDGTKLASASSDNSVRVWDVVTGQPITVIVAGYPVFSAVWSPDGQKIAYGGESGLVQISYQNYNSGTALRGQYFDAADLTTTFKFFRLNPTINFNWAAASPDTAIAVDTFSVRWIGKVEPLYSQTYTFYVTHNDGARLWVNGTQLVNDWVNRTAAIERSGTITLAAGVKYDLKLEYYDNTGNASVKLEWASSSQARQVIPASQLYPPEGQLAFRGNTSGNEEVYIRNPDGSGELNVSNSTLADNNPVWSPDGSKVAFVSTRDGNEEIYMTNADGSGLRRLTNHASVDHQPAWSPDGTKLAFISQRTGSGDIYLITVVGTTGVPPPTVRVSSTYSESNVMWSPNGLWLTYDAYVSSTYGVEVFIVSSVSGSPIRLTTRSGIDAAPFWSPDGSKLAFRAPFGGGDQIWTVLTSSPYTLTRLTTLGNNHFQSWSPDGTKILFQSSRDGNNEIYTMNADGSTQTRLTNSPENESYSVWSADARQIAFVRANDIWLMNTNGSNPRNYTNTPARTESQIVWWQTKQSS